jgi:signal transduction histidine kinase
MAHSSTTRYQLTTSALTLVVGCVAGIVAMSLRERAIIEDALGERIGVVRNLSLTSVNALVGEDMGLTKAIGLLEELIRETKERPDMEVEEIEILDVRGRILTHTDRSRFAEIEDDPLARRVPLSNGVSHWYQSGAAGLRSNLLVASPLRIGSQRWGGIVVRFGMAGVNARLTETLIQILSLVGALTLVNFLSVGWVVRRWMNPITEMTRQMATVQSGNIDVRVPADRQDEIGVLSHQFNLMLKGLRRARRQREDIARKQSNIEKLAALGRLSAGVAHEINNPLGGILTCLESLRYAEVGSPRHQEYTELVRSGLERIASTVQQLLRFARGPETPKRVRLDLHQVIDEALAFSRFQNRQNRVTVVRSLGEVPNVIGDPDLLHQVFLNLILNALQAMPDGGTLEVGTWASDGLVTVVFEDNGPGIPQADHQRIFDPFFTTKEVGVGTGLGLSVALGIVEANEGTIEVSDSHGLGGGARFSIHFPAARDIETESTDQKDEDS